MFSWYTAPKWTVVVTVWHCLGIWSAWVTCIVKANQIHNFSTCHAQSNRVPQTIPNICTHAHKCTYTFAQPHMHLVKFWATFTNFPFLWLQMHLSVWTTSVALAVGMLVSTCWKTKSLIDRGNLTVQNVLAETAFMFLPCFNAWCQSCLLRRCIRAVVERCLPVLSFITAWHLFHLKFHDCYMLCIFKQNMQQKGS